MAIQIKTGSGPNDWTTVSPQIKTGPGSNDWTNVNKGEIKTGPGATDWSTFYQRFSGTVNTPTITLSSRTISSITVQVTLPTGSPYKTQVTVYRENNALGASNIPAPPAVGQISGFKTETGLNRNTSYSFSAYALYYDPTTNELLQQSATVTQSFSTLDFAITTPTAPSNTNRQQYSLSFSSSSSANYSTNGATAYIQFLLYRSNNTVAGIINSINLPNDDTTATRTVQFTGLDSGASYYCVARTVYGSPVNQSSLDSSSSGLFTTLQYQTVYAPSSTTFAAGNNSTHFMQFAASGTSFKDASKSYEQGSDGNTQTEWMSNPYTTGTINTNETRTISALSSTTQLGGIVTYTTNQTHNLTDNTSNYTSVTINNLLYSITNIFSTSAYVFVDIPTTAPASLSGSFSVNGCSNSAFNTNYTIDTYTLFSGFYRIRAVRPSSVPSGITPAAPRGSAIMTGSANGNTIASLGGGPGESNIFTSNNTTFNRFDTSATNISSTTASGSVTYTVSSQGQVAKTSPNEEILRLAFRPNLPTGATNVQLQAIQTRCGGVGSPYIVIEINGNAASRTLSSGLTANTIDTWSVPANIAPDTTNLGVSNCWYIALTVRSGNSGGFLYSTISEVQIRYSYQILG